MQRERGEVFLKNEVSKILVFRKDSPLSGQGLVLDSSMH
jgi:hypothetical protein